MTPDPWIKAAERAVAEDEPCALITIVSAQGSVPRGVATRMTVTGQSQAGTIGGGNLEYQAVEQARRLLAQDVSLALQDFPLGPLLEQCCGGYVRLLIERLGPGDRHWLERAANGACFMLASTPAGDRQSADTALAGLSVAGRDGTHLDGRFDRDAWAQILAPVGRHLAPVYLFGAGHVGQAAAKLLAELPVALTLWDQRADVLPADWAGPQPVTDDWRAVVTQAPAGSAFVVFTHSHQLDYEICAAALSRVDAAYVGLIGSATKRARFDARWAAEGLTEAQRGRLVCPVGGISLKSKEPAMIALALAHELMQRLENMDGD